MTELGPVTAQELLRWPLFEGEEPDAVAWIASQMTVYSYEPGETVVSQGDAVDKFVFVLEGEIHFRRDGDDVAMFIAEPGDATGVLPFSRMKTWAGRGWAERPLRLAMMDTKHHREMVFRAPLVAQRLVAEMTDRAREFTRMGEMSNRLLALGKLSAGLAHELNNPASAAVRSSSRLREALAERRKCALEFIGEVLPAPAREAMYRISLRLGECVEDPVQLDPLERADQASDLADWLSAHGLPDELAPGLMDCRITAEEIATMISQVRPELLAIGLRIAVLDHEILCLTRELEEASHRVSELVKAVKSYSYMDQSQMSEVDVAQGIDVTLRMFQHKLKQGIQVERKYAPDLPLICANGSALNQIWTNLIDNSIDALDGLPEGQPRIITIRTCTERDGILVEIGDNGPGIPDEVRDRIFEPFFTTKSVGDGSGLGLDIVQRIVRTHKGAIRVDSIPGRTMFQIRLPL